MKLRIGLAIAFAITGIALAGCPREQTPPHEGAPTGELPMPASLAPPASSATPSANPATPASIIRMRAPEPEPDPLIPPPPPPPVDK
jgi:hypothetical protein